MSKETLFRSPFPVLYVLFASGLSASPEKDIIVTAHKDIGVRIVAVASLPSQRSIRKVTIKGFAPSQSNRLGG
jgi:hypothetical protein